MDLGLRGRSALVTGASMGIGRAIAVTLAQEGVNLHLAARSAEALEELAAGLQRDHGVAVTAHALDLSQAESVDRLAAAVPLPDILVNNAGAIPSGRLDTVDRATWRAAWDLKVYGYIDLSRAILPRMLERGSGVVINITGVAGERPDVNYVAGSAANAGLMAFSRALGGRSLDQGCRVLAVSPGAIATERLVKMFRTQAETNLGDPERWREIEKNWGLPGGRAGSPEEVADLVAFLASDRAAYVSGTVITIDGGIAARGIM